MFWFLSVLWWFPVVAVALSGQCSQPYKNLTSGSRLVTFATGTGGSGDVCDGDAANMSLSTLNDWAGEGWYRFGANAGTQLAMAAPRMDACGARFMGWLNGSVPAEPSDVVELQVCFATPSDTCETSVGVGVVNCSTFLLYRLPSPPPMQCYRYC